MVNVVSTPRYIYLGGDLEAVMGSSGAGGRRVSPVSDEDQLSTNRDDLRSLYAHIPPRDLAAYTDGGLAHVAPAEHERRDLVTRGKLSGWRTGRFKPVGKS